MDIIRYHFTKINSTRTYVKENYSSFDSDKLTLVTADEQEAGCARFGRTWISPPGNIYATAYYIIPPSCVDYTNTPQVVTLSIVHVLQKEGIAARLKWPNDILVNNKKVGGVMGDTYW